MLRKRITYVWLALLFSGAVSVIADDEGSEDGRGAGQTRVVGQPNIPCPNAQYTTIAAAGSAAASGDVIAKCPPLEPEQLVITKPLPLRGIEVNGIKAQGHDIGPDAFRTRSPAGLRKPDGITRDRILQSFGRLPLSFEVNQGQTAPRVKFISRGSGYTLFLTGDAAVLDLNNRTAIGNRRSPGSNGKGHSSPTANAQVDGSANRVAGNTDSVLTMRLVEANPHALVSGEDVLPGKSNYIIGNDMKKWETNVPTYAKVKYAGVYPGVDLVYYGNQSGQLECDFVLAPGADPRAIKLAVVGTRGHAPHIAANGDLVANTGHREVRFHKPVVYQGAAPMSSRPSSVLATGLSSLVEGHYALDSQNRVRFELGPYDHSRPLIVDPVLVWGTYASPYVLYPASGIALDPSGNIYLTADTQDSTFQGTPGSFDPTYPAGANLMTVVMKLNPSATAVVYSTLLGGNEPIPSSYANNFSNSLTVDSNGDAIVGGETYATNFPTTPNGWRTTSGTDGNGDTDWFNGYLTVLSPDGSSLIYSTYVGGTDDGVGDMPANSVYGVAVDAAGKVYATGMTDAANWGNLGGFEAQCPAPSGECMLVAYVAKFDPALSGAASLVYFSYLGGGGSLKDYGAVDAARGFAIAVDSNGNAYVTGYATTSDFPVTPGAFQTTFGDAANCPVNMLPANTCADAFVAKINPTASALLYSTYLGGLGADFGYAIAVDASGNAYVTGVTTATNYPLTPNAFQASNPGGGAGCCSQIGTKELWSGSAFVTELNPGGSSEVYSTYFSGNSGGTAGTGIAVDSSGDMFLSTINSAQYAPLLNSFSGDGAEAAAGIVAEFLPSGSLAFSTGLPTANQPNAQAQFTALTLDAMGNAYVAGFGIFPTTPGVINTNISNTAAAALAKLSPANAVSALVTPASLNFSSQSIGTSSQQAVQIYSFGSVPLNITAITASGDFSADASCVATQTFDAPCSINVTFTPVSSGALSGILTIADNAPNSPQTVALAGTGVIPVAILSPKSLAFGNQMVRTTSTPQQVTLSNIGPGNLLIPSIVLSGAHPGDYAQTNTCPISPSTLAVGADCAITVTFKPLAEGSGGASLSITDNALGSPQKVALSGTGLAPLVKLSQTSLTFASQKVGTTSLPQSVTLTNAGNETLTISSTTITGKNTHDFAQTNTCASSVAAGQSCTITVTFTPKAKGTRNASVSVSDNAGGSPKKVSLTGTGS